MNYYNNTLYYNSNINSNNLLVIQAVLDLQIKAMDNLDALIDEESQILRELQELSPFDEDGIPKEVLFGDTGFIPINTSPPVCKCLACRDDPEFNMSPPDPSDIYMGHNPHYCKYFPLEEEIIDQAPVLMDTNAGKSSNNKSEEAGREEIEININDLLNRSPESHPSKYITPEERKSFTYRPIIFEPHPMRKFVKDGSPIPSPITSNKSDTSGMSTPEGPFILIHPPRLNSLIKASESSSFQEQPVQTEASYRKSTLIVAIRRFAKATKIPNEDIVGAIDNLHLRFKDHKHSELFPPSDSRSTNDSFSGDAAFQVKVPLIPFNMGDPSETMHSFCILKVKYR